ncbi:hypothetical protein [Bacillus sp. RAR_GA_16]|uniref:hypothetical protein n=1 Tax=Bacillus sp. RAR_GA_16 TaxID=2876774 RepID=UPI001CCF39BA|nr:hypothetical protein [Bacillus sp. RAR_GA_16]MCA0174571.1 hypothetical protein [Bacillus sp. RAR_GA_16]
MSKDVIASLELLNEMRKKESMYGKGSYGMDRIELALDYVLNKPEKTGCPKQIVNNAMGSAGKQLRSRMKLHETLSTKAGINSIACIEPELTDELEVRRFELVDEIQKASLNNLTKAILSSLSSEGGAQRLSDEHQLPIKQMRTKISRARAEYKACLKAAI